MTLPHRKYLGLPKAAEILNCTLEDIVHWASHEVTRIGIPFDAKAYVAPIYEPDELSKGQVDYGGFAFINAAYLLNAELSGKCTFDSLDLDSGQTVRFDPIFDNDRCDWGKFAKKGLESAHLFIRTEEFEQLKTHTKQSTDKPESTRKTENLLRALTCVAINAYGYDPRSGKSLAPSDITEALSKEGFIVDPKTIRGWLKEGAELLEKKKN